MALKPKRTVVTLEGEDVLQLQEILMDADAEGALAFLREVVAKKLGRMQEETHKPEFEGGGHG